MIRRKFITLLGGATAAGPLATRAQRPAKIHRIGYLSRITPSADVILSRAERIGVC